MESQRYRCSSCRGAVGPGAAFCPSCGTKFGEPTPNAAEEFTALSPSDGFRSSGITPIQGLALVTAVIILGTILLASSKGAGSSTTPAATPQVLLTLSGNGVKNSGPFSASGDSVAVAYSFDCTSFGFSGNFIAELVGADGFPKWIANAMAKSGKDTTTVYLSGTSGPYHIEVNSECSWSVIVAGMP
jgi:hypothetical protein